MKDIIIEHVTPINRGYSTDNKKYKIKVSNKCPICNTGIVMDEPTYYGCYTLPVYFADANNEHDENFYITSIYRCSHCKRAFIVRHKMINNDELLYKCKQVIKENEQNIEIASAESQYTDSIWSTIETVICENNINKIQIAKLEDKCNEANAEEISQEEYPYKCFIDINEDIYNISPKFYEIYKQCMIAESMGLTEIYSMGLRKALEQLVTDYIINTGKGTKENATNMSLHNRIETYFSKMPETRDFLMAAKWIGNNETHYINNNTQEDRENLKIFIMDALDYIAKECRHQKAMAVNNNKSTT